MLRPNVLYNKRALQIAAALDATCDHLDRSTSFDFDKAVSTNSFAVTPKWVREKEFQGAECARLQRNREVVIRTLALNGDAAKYARGEAMKHIDPLFCGDRDFVYSAVQVNGLALKHAPEEFKADRPLVITAVKQNGMALEYASPDLKDDCEVCCYAVAQTEKAMVHVGRFQKDCYEVLLAADRTGKLRDNREWMLAAVQDEPHLLQYASRKLLMDEDVVMAACQEDGLCLAYASRILKADSRVVRCAVEQNGLALEYAGATNQNNITTVNCAIKQNGMALQYASEALKADKRVVLRALQFNGLALQFANEVLRRDKGVVIRAIKENPKAFLYAHSSVKRDPEFSSKRMQKLLASELEAPSFTEEEIAAQHAEALRRGMENDAHSDGSGSVSLPGLPLGSEVPVRMPDHPPNGALVPTWQMQSPGNSSTSFQAWNGSPAPSSPANSPTKLPTVRRSFSSPTNLTFSSPGHN